MKTIGLIGGMSWESSAEYYRFINEGVKAQLGGLHSAQCVMWSVDFAEIETMQHQGRWDDAGCALADAAVRLERAGAEVLVLCTNTMHKVAPAIEAATHVPLLHIADPTAHAIAARGLKNVGLLGTRFTMEQDFYRGRLEEKFGLNVIVPDETDRNTVHRIIYDELCLGVIRKESKTAYVDVIQRLASAGAQAIILGCTEIGLLIKDGDVDLSLFDTTRLHAEAAVQWAIE